ncbi:MAG TPA: hypothetical protein VH500_20405 [Nitrososphaeraceae archaeon]
MVFDIRSSFDSGNNAICPLKVSLESNLAGAVQRVTSKYDTRLSDPDFEVRKLGIIYSNL